MPVDGTASLIADLIVGADLTVTLTLSRDYNNAQFWVKWHTYAAVSVLLTNPTTYIT